MAERKKSYQVKFPAAVIEEAHKLYIESVKEVIYQVRVLSVTIGDETWEYDNEDDFYVEYRKAKGVDEVYVNYSYLFSGQIYTFSLSYDVRFSEVITYVRISLPSKADVGRVFDVFERNYKKPRTTKKPNNRGKAPEKVKEFEEEKSEVERRRKINETIELFRENQKKLREILDQQQKKVQERPEELSKSLLPDNTSVYATTQPPSQFIAPSSLVTIPSSSASNIQTNGILIATVTRVEAQAVLEVFSQAAGQNWTRLWVGNKTYYNLGVHGGAPVFMVQSEMGSATPGGAQVTMIRAIQDLQPQAVIMCGIAFGLRPGKQQLGDILVARQLEYYGPQRVDLQQGWLPRGDRTTSAERLLDRFRSGDNDWRGAQTHFGLLLSGELLVNDPTFRDRLLETEPEAIGGEMEGAGLYVAARDARVDWILVKSICDWADGTKNNDAQPQAARNAAQFVLHVLQLGGWGAEQLPSKEEVI